MVAADLLEQLESLILNSAEQEMHFCVRCHLLLKSPDHGLAFQLLSMSSYMRVSYHVSGCMMMSLPAAFCLFSPCTSLSELTSGTSAFSDHL